MILLPQTDKQLHTLTFTWLTLGVNVVCFAAQQTLHFGAWEQLLNRWGMVSATLPQHPETLVTAQFIHTGLTHLVSNMMFLWVFGWLAEARLGSWLAGSVYLSGGVFGYLVYAATHQQTTVPLVGASSAIAALMGVVAVLTPLQQVQLWLVVLPPFTVPVWAVLGVWTFMQATGNFTPFAATATIAHLGGFAVGCCTALALRFVFAEDSTD